MESRSTMIQVRLLSASTCPAIVTIPSIVIPTDTRPGPFSHTTTDLWTDTGLPTT
uniref:Uncharacterized protein n=1 Tax=Dendroctonus ponderosae TaxID=77166 RepID=J3JXE6_DENPD|nr:unknown [Dendroctonus ponderosae]